MSLAHAGRIYPPEILAAARASQPELERLEDGWSDLIASRATEAGATVVQALWARAVADCNRGEGQMAPGEVAPQLRAQFSAPGRKERAGLGVIPTRLADVGPLWKKPLDRAALAWRLESLHRPFHAALTDALEATRARFGHAILVDLHSMPSIPPGQAGHGAQIVVGDRFGDTADPWLVDAVVASAERFGVPVSRNQPYAGGHIVRTHGRPDRGVQAVQIEIDRSLYLRRDRTPDSDRLKPLSNWFYGLLQEISAAWPGAAALPQAAE
ncbi:N-formylglutamate amidohydrolase [Sphingopyxis sp. QXT-31]|nr:N-formylglutamate amidohydrolase [Sphingopyxis sp. QXT-31]